MNRIVASAIKIGTKIIIGKRHNDCYNKALQQGVLSNMNAFEFGFIDEKHKYYNRHEAYILASRNGQLDKKYINDENEILMSEDLW
jgi:hypothetical protein